MKRRRFVQALVVAPAAPLLLAQQLSSGVSQQSAAPGGSAGTAVLEDTRKLETAAADSVAQPIPHFFSAPQFAALRRLSDLLMPGSLATDAVEFLDFLIGQSPQDRQQLYRSGLDALNAASKQHFNKMFDSADDTQAATLLAPLRAPWTPDPPSDVLSRFLLAAKQDVRTATVNSRSYAAANVGPTGAGGGRRGGGGLYWYPLD